MEEKQFAKSAARVQLSDQEQATVAPIQQTKQNDKKKYKNNNNNNNKTLEWNVQTDK